jgi:hypothetical protein
MHATDGMGLGDEERTRIYYLLGLLSFFLCWFSLCCMWLTEINNGFRGPHVVLAAPFDGLPPAEFRLSSGLGDVRSDVNDD